MRKLVAILFSFLLVNCLYSQGFRKGYLFQNGQWSNYSYFTYIAVPNSQNEYLSGISNLVTTPSSTQFKYNICKLDANGSPIKAIQWNEDDSWFANGNFSGVKILASDNYIVTKSTDMYFQEKITVFDANLNVVGGKKRPVSNYFDNKDDSFIFNDCFYSSSVDENDYNVYKINLATNTVVWHKFVVAIPSGMPDLSLLKRVGSNLFLFIQTDTSLSPNAFSILKIDTNGNYINSVKFYLQTQWWVASNTGVMLNVVGNDLLLSIAMTPNAFIRIDTSLNVVKAVHSSVSQIWLDAVRNENDYLLNYGIGGVGVTYCSVDSDFNIRWTKQASQFFVLNSVRASQDYYLAHTLYNPVYGRELLKIDTTGNIGCPVNNTTPAITFTPITVTRTPAYFNVINGNDDFQDFSVSPQQQGVYAFDLCIDSLLDSLPDFSPFTTSTDTLCLGDTLRLHGLYSDSLVNHFWTVGNDSFSTQNVNFVPQTTGAISITHITQIDGVIDTSYDTVWVRCCNNASCHEFEVWNLPRIFNMGNSYNDYEEYGYPSYPTRCVGDTIWISCNQDSLNFYGIDSITLTARTAFNTSESNSPGNYPYLITGTFNCEFPVISMYPTEIGILFTARIYFHDSIQLLRLGYPIGVSNYYRNDTSVYTSSEFAPIWTAECCASSYNNPPVLTLQTNRTNLCHDTATITAQGVFSHYIWNTDDTTANIKVSQAGTYTCIATNGCTSDTAGITVFNSLCCTALGSAQTATICANDSFLFNGSQLTQSGTYKDTLQTSQGCDSIITLTLVVNPPPQSSFTQTICTGNSFSFNGENLTQSGTYKDTLQTTQGCDSIITLTLTVNSPLQNNLKQTICAGNSILFNGINYSASGIYRDTLQTSQGCDSIITLTLVVNPPLQGSFSQTICAGNSALFNGVNYSASGIYKDTLQTSQGCDSITTLNLTVLPLIQSNLNQTICEGDFYLFNGTPLSQSGTYIDTIKTAQNCAVTTLSLTVSPLPELVSAENYFEIEVGDSVTLSACASGDKYAWIANAATVSTNSTISVSPKVSLQTYTCVISNETGCADTCFYTVKVNGIYGNIYVPNAFSPNGDGKNDVFEIFGNYIRVQHFAIFNRWGEKVYETTNANPAWNGTFKGVPQPAGVYTYELTYFSGVQSVAEFLRGAITVVR